MKKKLMFTIPLLVVTVLLISVSTVSSNGDTKPTVVCTTTILSSFAEQVGGDNITVHSIVPPGICPAHYDITPSDVYAVSTASLVIYSGFEPWLDDLIEASGVNVTRVKVGGPWHPYTAALEYVTKIRDALNATLPEYSSYFEENAQAVCEAINATAQAIKEEADELNVSQVKVVCMQWQNAFVSWLGFNITATYGPPEKLTTSEILNLTSTAEKEEVALVIDNLPSGTEFGAKLAADVGAQHVILTNFPGAVPDTENYSRMIEYNARQLFEAVERHRLIQGEISELTVALNNTSMQVKILTATTIILLATTAVEAIVIYRRKSR
ncbi:hypothetical protein DRO69_11440 [Candidatus Bathyarchaeota archaeon]|nr:MAG: hypothetical protein DRO69_11440 [Candidatus Bathyarchaeota archaeon]